MITRLLVMGLAVAAVAVVAAAPSEAAKRRIKVGPGAYQAQGLAPAADYATQRLDARDSVTVLVTTAAPEVSETPPMNMQPDPGGGVPTVWESTVLPTSPAPGF